jgi:hypothetical protein
MQGKTTEEEDGQVFAAFASHFRAGAGAGAG